MSTNFQYAFIIFYNPNQPDGFGFMGNTYSTVEKYKGNVRFSNSLCEIAFLPWKINLVRYVPIVGRFQTEAAYMEVVYQFDKRWFKGTFHVENDGIVKWQREGSSDWEDLMNAGTGEMFPVMATVERVNNPDAAWTGVTTGAAINPALSGIPSGNTAVRNPDLDTSSTVTAADLAGAISFGIQIDDLEMRRYSDDKGRKLAEFTIPYRRLCGNEDMPDAKFGIISYFVSSMSTYIRASYVNHNFAEAEEGELIGIFYPPNTPLDFSAVGSVNTQKSIYLARFMTTGERLVNSKYPDLEVDAATDVVLVAKFPHKRVLSITQKEDGVMVTMVLDNLPQLANKNTEAKSSAPVLPVEGQSPETYLNLVVSDCLKNGTVDYGISILESYKEKISAQTYDSIKLRLLFLKCKDATRPDVNEWRQELVDCIDRVLISSPGAKTTYKLSLLLEKAQRESQLGQQDASLKTFREWLSLYQDYVQAVPEAANGLKINYNYVTQALENYAAGGTAILPDTAGENTIELPESQMDDFIIERLEAHSCGELGESYERWDDLKAISESDAAELQRFLESSLDTTNYKWYWPLARIYSSLDEAPLPIIDEIVAEDRQDVFLRKALLDEAHALKSNNIKELNGTALLYCYQSLRVKECDNDLTAAIGTVCLTGDEFTKAQRGALHFEDIIRIADSRDPESLLNVARALTELSFRSPVIKDAVQKLFAGLHDDTLQKNLCDAFAKLAGSGDSLSELYDLAIRKFEQFYIDFQHLPLTGRLGENATVLKDFLNEPSHSLWMDEDRYELNMLRNIFRVLSDYDLVKGFPEKSKCILSATNDILSALERIQKYPTFVSYYLHTPMLETLYHKSLNTYRSLCKTTKPLIKIGEIESAEYIDGRLSLTIPITSGSNNVQDALDVFLIIEESSDYECETRIPIRSNFPCDGRCLRQELPIRLKAASKEVLSLKARIEYRYISDVSIEEHRVYKKRRKARVEYYSKEVFGTGFYPGPDLNSWKSLEFSIAKKHSAHEISLDRVDQFVDNGASISFEDQALLNILHNRDDQINDAIRFLTEEKITPEGPKRVLRRKGRWVLLYGQWRVGKTVIMKCIEDKLKNKADYPHAILMWLSLEGTSDKVNFEDYLAGQIIKNLFRTLRLSRRDPETQIYAEVLEEVNEFYDFDYKSKDFEPSWEQMIDFMSDFLQDIRQHHADASIVLLVDEFTEIYQAIIRGHAGDRFPARWTEFVTKADIMCITAGGEHTISLMDTYAPNTRQKAAGDIYVDYLSKPQVTTYLRYITYEAPEDHVSPEDTIFTGASEEAIDRIYTLTGGNTFLLKNFCAYLIRYMNEAKRPYLTKNVVDGTLDYILRVEGVDVDSLESRYFNSLYDPFKECSEIDEDSTVRRIEDDRVRDDNQRILHKIVELADRDTHLCPKAELSYRLSTDMGSELFEKRFNTLKTRKILKVDENENVKIFIDLYFEIVSRTM